MVYERAFIQTIHHHRSVRVVVFALRQTPLKPLCGKKAHVRRALRTVFTHEDPLFPLFPLGIVAGAANRVRNRVPGAKKSST